MRATELMIGDIVMAHYDDGETQCYFPSIVIAIFVDRLLCNDGVQIKSISSEYSDFCDEDCINIEPIPLTAEILEKNGMKPFNIDNLTDKASAKWWHKSGYFFIKQYHFKHNGFKQTYSFGCNSHTLIEGIEYVHELQHAMKLCRINNEIVL